MTENPSPEGLSIGRFRVRFIVDEDLRVEDIPSEDAAWDEVNAFALSSNTMVTYAGHGSDADYDRDVREVQRAFREGTDLTQLPIRKLRATLWFEQRGHRWRSEDDLHQEPLVREILRALRSMLAAKSD